MFIISSCLLLAAATAAVPLEGTAKPPTCTFVGPVATDMFDNVKVVPALPVLNAVIGPTPTGTYLTYNNFAYANIGGLSNVDPPSEPNDIYVSGQQTDAYLTPTFRGANTFSLGPFRYACIARTGATVFEVAPKCTFQVTCDVFGGGTRSRSFTFVPDSLLQSTFNYGSFTPDFINLTQCHVQLVSATVGNLVDSPVAASSTVLILDDIQNRGQKCSA